MNDRSTATDGHGAPPAFTERLGMVEVPSLRLSEHGAEPEVAYRFIHGEVMLDGNARLNLATFVTTWMEPQAERLLSESFDKNMIDTDEYPSAAEIERRCVNIVADLFHAEGLSETDATSATGVSTLGSSEAVMLAGLAMKWRWRAARKSAGQNATTPKLVLGTNVQVVWEKFCRYFDVEPVYLPMEPGRYVVTPEQVRAAVDEDTIGVVAILGTTFTGELEPITEIAAVLDEVAQDGPDVPLHVDAASGGFVVPFLQPDLEWDFRNPRVVSINVSGHKYGLTYPGIGFVVWRSPEYLPEDLVFHVNYLGGDMPTFTLNFSRPGNQVIGQYYNFVRLGRQGYRTIMESLRASAERLAGHIEAVDGLRLITNGSAIPVLTFACEGDPGFTVFDISHELRARGFQVPAYTMPAEAEEVAVLRVVIREGFNADLTHRLGVAIAEVVAHLRTEPGSRSRPGAFAH